jgi:hypothetical protein
MRLALVVLASTLAMSARSLAAQDARLSARLAEPDRALVQALLDSARADGLPVEPLIDRALEGAAKRATGDRILAAVSRLRGELAAARDALGSRATTPELTAGASALRVGATAADLRRLRELRGAQPVTVAAAVLADLVAVGVPGDSATVAVLRVASLVDDAEFLAFRRNVERDVAMGASPVAALTVRLTGISDVRAAGGEAGAAPTPPGSPRPGPRKP